MTCPRLIEVALPIREISAESDRQKKAQRGHISTLHLWWARRPLAATRAIVFASLVPDPDHPECPAEFRRAVARLLKDQVPSILKSYYASGKQHRNDDAYKPYKNIPDTPRNRLLTFIAKWSPQQIAFDAGHPLGADSKLKEPPPPEMLDDRCLVKWETGDPENEQGQQVLHIARELIRIANGGQTPVVLDPFAGGGAIPLEADRLGAEAIANDYNPVAYLILRATCEFPQKFGKPGKRVVQRDEYARNTREEIQLDNVLTYDVERWVNWIIERAKTEIGQFFPPGKDGNSIVGYLWARTAHCSNPTCRAEVPLLRSLVICKKKDRHVALAMTHKGKQTDFGIVKNSGIKETDGTMLNRGDCRCPICGQVTPVEDLRRAGLNGKLGERMVAVITSTQHGKDYRAVEPTDLDAFENAKRLSGRVELPREKNADSNDAGLRVHNYGFKTFGSFFNPRQLVVMQTLMKCLRDALAEIQKSKPHDDYFRALAVYLGIWISRSSARYCSLTVWHKTEEKFEHPFGRQSIPMNWDYPEPNPFAQGSAGLEDAFDLIRRVIIRESQSPMPARVLIGDGANLPLVEGSVDFVVTDPPYFDPLRMLIYPIISIFG